MILNYISDFINSVFYQEEPMTPEQESYNQLMKERQEKFDMMVYGILRDIESVCREQTSITFTEDYGFDKVSPILFEDSLHEKVVNHLQSLGYRCMMSFDYENGQLQSSLTVSWG